MKTPDKKSCKYKMNSSIVIREEKDFYLIYDKKRRTLLQSEYDPRAFLENWNSLHTEDTTAINDLIENGVVVAVDSNVVSGDGDVEVVKGEAKAEVEAEAEDDEDSSVLSLSSFKSEINPFWILWEITPKCNLRCVYCLPKHKGCCQEIHNNDQELNTQELLSIAAQIVSANVFEVTITGGEALLSPSIWPVLDFLNENGIQCNVLSNGTTITEDIAHKLSTYQTTVSVSVDSAKEEINSITRGKKILEKSIRGIDLLKKYNIPVNIISTVTRHNFDHIEDLFTWAKSYGIGSVVLQDLRAFQDLELYNSLRLTLAQENKLRVKLENLKSKYKSFLRSVCELNSFHHSDRPYENQKVMDCPSGDHSAYLDHSGNLYPCSSLLTFCMGNLLKENLTHIWQKSPAIVKLRKLKKQDVSTIHSCGGCPSSDVCGRGCRGDAEITAGDLFARPSRCPERMQEELTE
ncbi:MAG: radical SAM protein [Oligoflexia bacterium]|nr:radical SAM protein [Oligoflexia bacterium]